MSHTTYVFDAYGTLFDVHAAVRHHIEAVGPDAAAFSETWRAKQLEYSWTRALMGRYRDFWALTEEALDFCFGKYPSADRSLKPALLDAYMALDAYPEVHGVLKQLKEKGMRLAILSNGSPKMLDAAVQSAGLSTILDDVFSVDELETFKSDPQVYDMVTTQYRVFPEAVSFQSSNRWDIAGAQAFGFRCVWINRAEQPDEYLDLKPAAVLKDLEGLLGLS